MGRVVAKKMTEEQRSLVVNNLGIICSVAYRVWRRASLPNHFLDELRSQAFVEGCLRALYYYPGDRSFADVVSWHLHHRLWSYVSKIRLGEELEESHLLVEDLEEEERIKIDIILQFLPTLPKKQRAVIERRYGLDGRGALTWGDIARDLHLRRSNVIAIGRRALSNLQKKILRGGLECRT